MTTQHDIKREFRATGRCSHRSVHLCLLLTAALVLLPSTLLRADDDEDKSKEKKSKPSVKDVMKPTEVGLRFTPRMARSISKQFTKEMKRRYELDDKQTEDVRDIISYRLMKLVQENATTGRDLIEMMAETMMENDGEFPKEAAIEFAKMSKPIIPAIKGFLADASTDIGKKMSMKQRLKLTGDMAAATAGILMFEGRMKRWEEGKVSDGANPFWDRADNDPEAATSQPEDSDEHPEYRRARKNVERWIDWQINIDNRWEEYVNQATDFYDLEEAQINAAKAILKDCRERAKVFKTPEWKAALKENRIAQRLTWKTGGKGYHQGPWMFKLEGAWEEMLQPLHDLEKELKTRIEEIPDSTQRAKAMEELREAFKKNGMENLPLKGMT